MNQTVWVKIAFLVGFVWCSLNAEETFLSPEEYGKMFYENPRGVSCIACHGKKGEGKYITKYKEEKEDEEKIVHKIYGPKINHLSLEQMIGALEKTYEIMPSYFLTNEEVKGIYLYLRDINCMGVEETKSNQHSEQNQTTQKIKRVIKTVSVFTYLESLVASKLNFSIQW